MMSMMPYYANRTLRTRSAAPARYVSPFSEDFIRSFFGESTAPSMKVDIEDKGDSYLLMTDLPGVKREDVRISVEDGILTIAAGESSVKTEEDKDRSYVCRERRSMSMSRSFSLDGVDEQGITAEYTDGVLHLTLPKVTETEPKARQIEIR